MKKETYIKMTQPFRGNAKAGRAIHIINKILTYSVFIAYPIFLLYLLFQRNPILGRAIMVPLDSFIIVSVFRHIVNRKRPYEYFGVKPVIDKDTKGKSFPSRHVFSAFVISMTFIFCSSMSWQWIVISTVLFLISTGIAIIRVVSGVHYISDVIAGAIVGIAAGLIGFMI